MHCDIIMQHEPMKCVSHFSIFDIFYMFQTVLRMNP